MRIGIEFPGRQVQVKVWQARVGHVTLYLLDTDLAENSAEDRDITHRLYGGDRNTRIQQEIVLGVGGVRALAALGITPTAWHMNEGHPAFLVLERVRTLVAQGMTFDAALEAVASNAVFTTHTPGAGGTRPLQRGNDFQLFPLAAPTTRADRGTVPRTGGGQRRP